MMMFGNILLIVAMVPVVFILVMGTSNDILLSSTETTTAINNKRVASGGAGAAWDTFSPQSVQINVGDSVTWYSPSPVPEPHTVTFLLNQSYFPPLAAPFNIPNDAQIIPALPDPNVEPIILPPVPSDTNNETKTVIMDNARAYNSVVIDSTGEEVNYLPPNSNYTMSGTELYINSGFMFPEGQIPPDFPSGSEFTVTFESPGTYNYLCVLHPWMTGNVVVG
jgi:plastocyanin